MRKIDWGMWANEQAFLSVAGVLLGGIVGVAGNFINWEFAAFTIPMAVILLALEYPRSRRTKGSVVERRFQSFLSPILMKLSPVTTNYYSRFVIHLICSIPCCFLLPTLMGGMCLMLAALIYLLAAIKGEEWLPVEDKPPPASSAAISHPPSRPPPRAPARQSAQPHDANHI